MKTTVSVVLQGMCERIAKVVVDAPENMSYEDICLLIKDELEEHGRAVTDGWFVDDEWSLLDGYDLIVEEMDFDHDERLPPQIVIGPDNTVTFKEES